MGALLGEDRVVAELHAIHPELEANLDRRRRNPVAPEGAMRETSPIPLGEAAARDEGSNRAVQAPVDATNAGGSQEGSPLVEVIHEIGMAASEASVEKAARLHGTRTARETEGTCGLRTMYHLPGEGGNAVGLGSDLTAVITEEERVKAHHPDNATKRVLAVLAAEDRGSPHLAHISGTKRSETLRGIAMRGVHPAQPPKGSLAGTRGSSMTSSWIEQC
jgi:hypothetical protein